MKVKTTELTGAALDWAVAKATDRLDQWTTDPARPGTSIIDIGTDDARRLMVYRPGKHRDPYEPWTPSTNWSQGGPIIEREGIAIHASPTWTARFSLTVLAHHGGFRGYFQRTGPTPLIAAMRCFVTHRLGGEVEIPRS